MLQWFLPYLAWIRLGCTCVPHPESPLPPPSPSHPSGPSQCTSPEHPVSCMEPGLMIWFTYENIHVSTRLSQSIPRSPSPAESKRLFCASVSLLQSRIQGYHYHLAITQLTTCSLPNKHNLNKTNTLVFWNCAYSALLDFSSFSNHPLHK